MLTNAVIAFLGAICFEGMMGFLAILAPLAQGYPLMTLAVSTPLAFMLLIGFQWSIKRDDNLILVLGARGYLFGASEGVIMYFVREACIVWFRFWCAAMVLTLTMAAMTMALRAL